MSIEQLKSTGNPDIDGAHVKIVEILEDIIDTIYNKNLDIVSEKINSLIKVTTEHFSEEEQLMWDIEYPFKETHLSAHRHIILSLLDLLKIYKLDFKYVEGLLNILKFSILNHVEHYDVNLFNFNKHIINTRLV